MTGYFSSKGSANGGIPALFRLTLVRAGASIPVASQGGTQTLTKRLLLPPRGLQTLTITPQALAQTLTL